MPTPPKEAEKPLGFEVEIRSGGRARDAEAMEDAAPAVAQPLSPARQAARERARRRNIALAVVSVLFVAGMGAWLWFTNPTANIPSDAVARVNGEFIYERDVAKRMDFTRLLNDLSKNPAPELPSATSKLEEMIYERMQIQDATKAGVKVTPGEIDAEVASIQAGSGKSAEQLTGALAKYNLTMDDLRAFVQNAVLIKKYKDDHVLAGATTVEDASNRENDWLTNLASTGKIERFKPVGTGQAPRVGAEAPDFTLKNIDGQDVSLQSLRGKPIMINFWATWCPPCRAEIPVITKMYGETHTGDGPYEVLGVATQSDTGTIKAFAGEFGMQFPLLPDANNSVVSAYHVLPIPTTFFIDRDGIIRHIQTGPVTRELMEKWLLAK